MKDTVMFTKALEFASKMHRKQTRRDKNVPYILHPIAVAEIVRDWGWPLKYQVVALLHDVLEDTKATEDDIREFGDDVLEAVKLLTKSGDCDEEEYLRRLEHNEMAYTVKAADKIHNMREVVRAEDKEWAKKYVAKSRKLYYDRFGTSVNQAIEMAELELSWQ